MWAQNATAMYSYAGVSRRRRPQLTPFTAGPDDRQPGRHRPRRPAAVAAATGQPGRLDPGHAAQVVTRSPPRASCQARGRARWSADRDPQSDADRGLVPADRADPLADQPWRSSSTAYSPFASFFYNTEGLPYFSVGMGNFGVQIAKSAGLLGGAAPAAAAAAPKAADVRAGRHAAVAPAARWRPVWATGPTIGHLAVPSSWPGAYGGADGAPVRCSTVSEPMTAGDVRGRKPAGRHARGRQGVAGARRRRRSPIWVQTHRHGPPTARRLTHTLTSEGASAAKWLRAFGLQLWPVRAARRATSLCLARWEQCSTAHDQVRVPLQRPDAPAVGRIHPWPTLTTTTWLPSASPTTSSPYFVPVLRPISTSRRLSEVDEWLTPPRTIVGRQGSTTPAACQTVATY